MHELARNTWIIAKREFVAYFSTPLATVFLIIFIALTGAFGFYVGGFFDRGQADLNPFFQYHPWLYLLLVPAVAMRLWAEERKSGTIELLDDFADLALGGDPGKILRGLGIHRRGAAADLADVDHGQRAGQPRQRRDLCQLRRQLPDGRCVPGHRLVHLGADQEPGDRLHRLGQHLLPAW